MEWLPALPLTGMGRCYEVYPDKLYNGQIFLPCSSAIRCIMPPVALRFRAITRLKTWWSWIFWNITS